jgi:rubrerythrin
MSKTDENMKRAYQDECATYMMYLAFAKQAVDEGISNISRLFRAMAEAETVHALNQIDALEWTQSTEDNLMQAIQEEEGDFFRTYPEFIRDAQSEDRTGAVMSLTWIQQSEKAHFELLRQALEALQKGGDIEEEDYYLCTNCGYVAPGAPPSSCPVCKAPQNMFRAVS